jgi:hypothetical protein
LSGSAGGPWLNERDGCVARASRKAGKLPITERDIPIGLLALSRWFAAVTDRLAARLFCELSGLGAHLLTSLSAALFWHRADEFLFRCGGYMAGLIGSPTARSPARNLVVIEALLLVIGVKPDWVGPDIVSVDRICAVHHGRFSMLPPLQQ